MTKGRIAQVRPGYAGPYESVIQTLGTLRGGVRPKGARGGNRLGSSPRSEAKRATQSGIVPAERSA